MIIDIVELISSMVVTVFYLLPLFFVPTFIFCLFLPFVVLTQQIIYLFIYLYILGGDIGS